MRKIRKPEQQLIKAETEGYELHENYIMYFGHFDGFTQNLLSIDLFIDTALNFELIISSNESPVLNSRDPFEGYTEGKLPISIQQNLNNLLSKKLDNIKDDYTDFHPGANGQGMQRYLINSKSKLYNIVIELDMDQKLDTLQFKSEKLLFQFNVELNNWLKFMYESMKNNTAYNNR